MKREREREKSRLDEREKDRGRERGTERKGKKGGERVDIGGRDREREETSRSLFSLDPEPVV